MRLPLACAALLLTGCWDLLAAFDPDALDSGHPPSLADGGLDSGTPDAGAFDAGADADAGLPPDDLTSTLEPLRQTHGFPGLSAAVFAGDRLIAVGATGVRKLGDPSLVTVNDRWHLGSITKSMTATLTALFVDEGKVSWDTPLATAFPAWATTMDPGYRAVTLSTLLGHRGGTPGTFPTEVAQAMRQPGSSRERRLAAVQLLLHRPPQNAVGTYEYSNAGYMVVGAALELATGTDWETLMRERLFTPLAMGSCGFGPPASPNAADQPWGHQVVGGVVEPIHIDNPPSIGPAGTVHCSLQDLGKYLNLHLRGARGEPTALVSAASLKKLHTPWPGGDYALGWFVVERSWGGGTVFSHSGSNTFFLATVWFAPAKNRIYLAATNRADTQAITGLDQVFWPLIQTYTDP